MNLNVLYTAVFAHTAALEDQIVKSLFYFILMLLPALQTSEVAHICDAYLHYTSEFL